MDHQHIADRGEAQSFLSPAAIVGYPDLISAKTCSQLKPYRKSYL